MRSINRKRYKYDGVTEVDHNNCHHDDPEMTDKGYCTDTRVGLSELIQSVFHVTQRQLSPEKVPFYILGHVTVRNL